MILFNGVALESVAPVCVEDVRVSPISMSATTRQRPVRWGADYVRMTGGSRTITITFGLPTNNRDDRQEQIRSIAKWARSDKPGKLVLPHHDGLYLEAICTALPDPSLRQWWDSRLRVMFATMDNPYWTSQFWKSAACGTVFTVLGSAPPIMRIERTLTSAAANQVYTDGERRMQFSSIPAGNLVIDLNRQTAAVIEGTTTITPANMAVYYPGHAFGGNAQGVPTVIETAGWNIYRVAPRSRTRVHIDALVRNAAVTNVYPLGYEYNGTYYPLDLNEIGTTITADAFIANYEISPGQFSFTSMQYTPVIDEETTGASIMSAYVPYVSKFIEPKTGKQTISGTGTVSWRERWE